MCSLSECLRGYFFLSCIVSCCSMHVFSLFSGLIKSLAREGMSDANANHSVQEPHGMQSFNLIYGVCMASSPSNELCYGPLCDSICMHGNFLCSNKYICRLLVSYIIYDLCSIIPVVGDLPVLKIRMNLGGHHRPYRYIQYIEVHLILV